MFKAIKNKFSESQDIRNELERLEQEEQEEMQTIASDDSDHKRIVFSILSGYIQQFIRYWLDIAHAMKMIDQFSLQYSVSD